MFPDLPPDQAARLQGHFELLQRWNKVINLTSEESVDRNYGESIFLAKHIPPGSWSIADIGSGAGFPGIPVGIVRPECTVTLIEAHQRKAVFLKEATRDLDNFRVLGRRVEDVEERFDWVMSRAVSFKDLDGHLQRLGLRIALLGGEEEAPEDLGVAWSERILISGSKNRFLRIGEAFHVKPLD